jgi:glyoxylase-like metal-dependent hydrolase (beta-lactamase superfamily II)
MKGRPFLPSILLLCVSGAPSAQDAADPAFILKQVGPNVWAAISNPKSKAPAGANTGFVIGDDGVAVIDTSASARLLGKDIKPQQRAFIEALRPPTITYDQGVDLHLGSREIRLRSFPGHTGGDSVALIPDANVVFAGDLFWRNTLPNLIDASTQLWIDTLDTLAKDEPDATFVPGHGDVGNAQDVIAFREYLATLRKLVSDAQATRKVRRDPR